MKQPDLRPIIFAQAFSQCPALSGLPPAAKIPTDFAGFVVLLVKEIEAESKLFYGITAIEHASAVEPTFPVDPRTGLHASIGPTIYEQQLEAQYPGIDYTNKSHRKRLRKFANHLRLFHAFDSLALTDTEILKISRWDGTLWHRERGEERLGVVIIDTTGIEIPTWRAVEAQARVRQERAREIEKLAEESRQLLREQGADDGMACVGDPESEQGPGFDSIYSSQGLTQEIDMGPKDDEEDDDEGSSTASSTDSSARTDVPAPSVMPHGVPFTPQPGPDRILSTTSTTPRSHIDPSTTLRLNLDPSGAILAEQRRRIERVHELERAYHEAIILAGPGATIPNRALDAAAAAIRTGLPSIPIIPPITNPDRNIDPRLLSPPSQLARRTQPDPRVPTQPRPQLQPQLLSATDVSRLSTGSAAAQRRISARHQRELRHQTLEAELLRMRQDDMARRRQLQMQAINGLPGLGQDTLVPPPPNGLSNGQRGIPVVDRPVNGQAWQRYMDRERHLERAQQISTARRAQAQTQTQIQTHAQIHAQIHLQTQAQFRARAQAQAQAQAQSQAQGTGLGPGPSRDVVGMAGRSSRAGMAMGGVPMGPRERRVAVNIGRQPVPTVSAAEAEGLVEEEIWRDEIRASVVRLMEHREMRAAEEAEMGRMAAGGGNGAGTSGAR